MDSRGDVDRELVERVHSRRTLITGAAMGVGAGLVAAAGAKADASPARASTGAQRRSAAERARRRSAGRRLSEAADPGADFVVQGTSSFSDVVSFARSGVVAIGAGQASATVTGVSLSSDSFVLATIQDHLGGPSISGVVPNVAGSSFTIFLTGPVPHRKTIQVGWFVVN